MLIWSLLSQQQQSTPAGGRHRSAELPQTYRVWQLKSHKPNYG
ncbi:hypothetical Protein YC6258_03921 [Gynuella sunshinyii YC6258]|uniref:Uncharacterized protein n=1 Tax=Gynuella sunshinyii YC6258 TaxID=1445510 RepID=A0A0C5VMJ8_9GAMM|nr:hypothetical Protein YC6258_03921 [Gynuella sunshinyii YC6258]